MIASGEKVYAANGEQRQGEFSVPWDSRPVCVHVHPDQKHVLEQP